MAQSKDYKNYLRRCRYRRPDVKEKIQSYNKKWAEEHPELMKEYNISHVYLNGKCFTRKWFEDKNWELK